MPASRISRSPTLIVPAETTSGLKSRSRRACRSGCGFGAADGSTRASGPITGGAAVMFAGVTLRTGWKVSASCSVGAGNTAARSATGIAPASIDTAACGGGLSDAAAGATATFGSPGAIAQ